MENKFNNFYDAYKFLYHHPMVNRGIMNYFWICLDTEVVKVDPDTNEINLDDNSKNTETQVWLEFGAIVDDVDSIVPIAPIAEHDMDLDCGASTFEDAIVILANLVFNKYGMGDDSSDIRWDNTASS